MPCSLHHLLLIYSGCCSYYANPLARMTNDATSFLQLQVPVHFLATLSHAHIKRHLTHTWRFLTTPSACHLNKFRLLYFPLGSGFLPFISQYFLPLSFFSLFFLIQTHLKLKLTIFSQAFSTLTKSDKSNKKKKSKINFHSFLQEHKEKEVFPQKKTEAKQSVNPKP